MKSLSKAFVTASNSVYRIKRQPDGSLKSLDAPGQFSFGPSGTTVPSAVTPGQLQVLAPVIVGATAGAIAAAGGTEAHAMAGSQGALTAILAGLNSPDVGHAAAKQALAAGATLNAATAALTAANVALSASLNTSAGVLTIDSNVMNTQSDYLASDFDGDYGPPTSKFDPVYFAPQGNALSRSVKIAYALQGTVASTNVTIYMQPVAKFIANLVSYTADSATVAFDFSSSQDYDETGWTFGDGASQTIRVSDNPATMIEHTYPLGSQGTFYISLAAMNGPIQDVSIMPVNPASLIDSLG